MKHYIGIDLGTTNSVIASCDGQETQVWKSPEQNDVTPSAIFVDRRGNRYYGRRAYEMAPVNEKNAATLFKRYMGTQTTFTLEAADMTLTPEECSAEILKVLMSYLPEEMRADDETAVVITVPAAFNQMKKDATLEAARLAGITHAALMQEPVAAVMGAVRQNPADGIFVIYDLGGGTFDVSIAENAGGKVSLLAQGGREMCGGRDWDRMLFDSAVVPWLKEHFHLPDDFVRQEQYKLLCRLALFAVEVAKIELSSADTACIRMDEDRLRTLDLDGNEIYLAIDVTRAQLNALIEPMIADTIDTMRETLEKSGISDDDVERIVFVGGPTNYKPLRDRVAAEMGVLGSNDLNPMTAVAEGASIFAESIDWQSQHHNRKASTQEVEGAPKISFRYEARCVSERARVAFKLENGKGLTAEIVSEDTGWSSGRMAISDGTVMEVPLAQNGENRFRVTVYGAFGRPVSFKEDRVVITRTLAAISSIPASCSVAVKVLDKLGGTAVPVYLVRENDSLPKGGTVTFKAGQTLKAGSNDALVFTLWEGNIPQPIEDNRYIGTYKIPGTSFDVGAIPTGADIICRYEMSDSGALHLGVSVPCVGADFGDHNFYSRQEGQLDLSDVNQVKRDGLALHQRVNEIAIRIIDPRIARARAKAMAALNLSQAADPETVQEAHNGLLEGRRLIAQIRRDHLREMRQMDLDARVNGFNEKVRQYAQDYDREDFETLVRTAQLAISRGNADFEEILREMGHKSFQILWKQDWYVISLFKNMTRSSDGYTNAERFEELKQTGNELIRNDWIGELRSVVNELNGLQIDEADTENMFDEVNVIRG